MEQDNRKKLANSVRSLAIDMIENAQSGHPGLPLGMADVATILFKDFLKFNPSEPTWFDRDRLVLSAGHGSALLYTLLYLSGYKEMSLEQLQKFRQLKSLTAGHPEVNQAAGIESTTGPLGQGLANAVGLALGESILRNKYGAEIVNHHTYAIAGDGCLMEGISYEAISLAGHLKLNNLIILFDDNNITIDGPTSLSTSEDIVKRFIASNWQVISIDGHDFDAIHKALTVARSSTTQPTIICCKTVIGYGSPNKSGKSSAHGSPLGEAEALLTKQKLNSEVASFTTPSDMLQQWNAFYRRNIPEYNRWINAYDKSLEQFKRITQGTLPKQIYQDLQSLAAEFITEDCQATRGASGRILKGIQNSLPELIGGSADLTGSNKTKTSNAIDISANQPAGNYINYGIREHAMAGIMNGLSLHGGFIPYGGTYLSFSDYCRPSIRLSALMHQRVIYVFTHDSIALGEDGPTHQPIEHLASLRAMPNINVLRPADSIETIESWQLALENKNIPTILALGRHAVKNLRKSYLPSDNKCAKGAYIIGLAQPNRKLDGCIIATGSEVEIAIQVQEILLNNSINFTVISMPCREIFEQQSWEYQNSVIAKCVPVFVIEAAASFGWEKYTQNSDYIFGINSFGESAPCAKLYEYFKLIPKDIAENIMKFINYTK